MKEDLPDLVNLGNVHRPRLVLGPSREGASSPAFRTTPKTFPGRRGERRGLCKISLNGKTWSIFGTSHLNTAPLKRQ